jgi:hypothetical protein
MALTADDRIVLIRVKVKRAEKHLHDLAADLLAARNVRTTVVGPKLDAHTGQATRGFVILPRLPFDAIATAGDIVHNLRSALDHLAYQLVIVGSGKEPSRRVEFPIAKDFATYAAEKVRKVEGMRPLAIQAIDNVKPYKGGNEPLWRIHELDNIDKHRTLFSVAHDYLFFGDWFDGDYWFKTDTPHFAGVFDQQMENDVQLEIDKAVGETKGASGNSLLPSLHQLVDFTDELITYFKPLLE